MSEVRLPGPHDIESKATVDTEARDPDTGSRPFWLDRAPRVALLVFVGVLVVALVLYLWAGRNRWFFGDEWPFLITRDAGSVAGLFEPHAEHWTTLPILFYRLMYNVFGLRTYVPYQLLTIVLHLTAAALLRAVMRRAGVGPWIATAAASLFALFGTGDSNILRGFQITFDGALVFGLVHLLLADHDGPVNRRDWLGLVAGLAGLMCSGVAVAMVVAVGVATLIRRGWRIALLHTVPLFTIFGLWWWLFARADYSRMRSSASQMLSFSVSAVGSTFSALGQVPGLGVALCVILVGGCVLAWRHPMRRDVRRLAALPVGLVAALAAFLWSTALSRAAFGVDYAEQSRYLHIVAALLIPSLAVAIDAFVRRWPVLVPIGVLLLLVGIPGNIDVVANQRGRPTRPERELYLAAAHVAIASQVPSWARPDPNLTPDLTLAWLQDGIASGRIPDPPPIEPALEDALTFRLSLQQIDERAPLLGCEVLSSPRELHLEPGDSFGFRGRRLVVTSQTLKGNERARLEFDHFEGETLVAVAGPLDVIVRAGDGGGAQFCGLRPAD